MNTHPVCITNAAAALIAALTTGVLTADAPQVHVGVNSPTGASALFQRTRLAAGRVCDVGDVRDPSVLAIVQACATHAVADAVATFNNPSLTGVY